MGGVEYYLAQATKCRATAAHEPFTLMKRQLLSLPKHVEAEATKALLGSRHQCWRG